LFAGGDVVDVEEGLVSPDGGERREAGLDVDADVAGMHGQGERLGRVQTAAELAVDEQCPHVAEGHSLGDEFFDVDPAIAQGATVLVGFGDVAREGDRAFESCHEILRHRELLARYTRLGPVIGIYSSYYFRFRSEFQFFDTRTMNASPWPPPPHRAAAPTPPPRRFSSRARCSTMRAPDMPSG